MGHGSNRMQQEFTRYTTHAASQETLAKVSYVSHLKEERLVTSMEAFQFLRELRDSKAIRDEILGEYRKEGIRNGWIPQLASIQHLQNLVTHMAPVVGLAATLHYYRGPDIAVNEHNAVIKDNRLEITVTLPVHEDVSAHAVSIDHETGELREIRMFSPERKISWSLSLISNATIAEVLSACGKGITEVKRSHEDKLESVADALDVFADFRAGESSPSLQEQILELGVLLGLSRVPYLARITLGGEEGDAFDLVSIDLLQTERMKALLSRLDFLERSEVRNDVRSLILTQNTHYSYPLPTSWDVIFQRAQEIENLPPEKNQIRDPLLRRAVGMAYIESLPARLITQNSRVSSAIDLVTDRLASFKHTSPEHPNVLRYQTLREILIQDREFFEEKIPALS